ncbi:MAG: right-handed parallel beta-helix repeat-containing protein [Parachlamydiales bacterium]
MRRLLLLLLLLPHLASAYEPSFHAYGRYGDFRQGGGAQAFIPLYQGCNWVTFAQLRLLRLKEQYNGAGGGGFRKQFGNSFGVGVNAFFDYSHADGAGSYFQGCGGVEMFGPCWDVSAHYYYPRQRMALADFRTEFVNFIDGTEIISDEFLVFNRVRPYKGYDINASLTAPLCWGRVRGWGGYFRYTSPHSQVVEGPRLRLYYEVDSPFLPWTGTRWAIGGEWQFDNVRKVQAAVVLTLRFNLCAGPAVERCIPCIPGICRRMNELVDRELGITIIRTEERELINEMVIANIFFVEQNGMGTGSQTDPTNLLVAETNSVAGDFIFLLNNNGEIDVSILGDDTFNMKADQTMVSFDSSSQVVLNLGSFGTVTVRDLTGAGRGVLAGATAASVTLANDNLICGIGVNGGPTAITGTGVASPVIDKSLFMNQTTNAIELAMSSNVTIENSTIQDLSITSGAIALTNLSGTTKVTGNTITNLTGAGNAALTFVNTNINAIVQVTNNTISGTANTQDGIALDLDGTGTYTVTVNNNTLTGLTGEGILVSKALTGGSLTATIEQNTLMNFGTAPMIQVVSNSQGSTLLFTIENNTLTNGSGVGIEIDPTSSGASLQSFQGRITNNTLSGIQGLDRIHIFSSLMNTGDVLRVAVESNTLSGVAAASGSAIHGEAAVNSAGNLSWTFTNNTDTSGSTGVAAYQADTLVGFVDTLCLTMMGNNTNNAMGINLDNSATTMFNVTDLGNLSANNNNITVTTTGPINSTTTCPLPP